MSSTREGQHPTPLATGTSLNAIVIGAGFAGLYMLYRLRKLGLSARVFEAGSGIGGTWFWNRYPGARCDIPSMEYSYQFDQQLEQEWEWSERYATQPEILDYINHVANRFNLRPDIELNTRIQAAHFDETQSRWKLGTADGREFSARYCIMATGCLSSANLPAIPGIDRFAGESYHTGRWPHEGVDFSGKRVAVIGTGSSAIQSIPLIADQASELYVFQRTPNYSVPAHNRPLGDEEQASFKANYRALRELGFKEHPFGFAHRMRQDLCSEATAEQRQQRYQEYWERGGLQFLGAYADLMLDKDANASAAEFLRQKIASQVDDPEVAAALTPRQVVGSKRLCVDTRYFATYNRPHVHLVDLKAAPIAQITEDGLIAGETVYQFDAIVYATGFDAMTGALARIDIRGRQGQKLADKWAAGPRTYLGLASAGFPNLFFITGPGSPSVLTNMLPSIEQHVNWISDCIAHLQESGKTRIEADETAQETWVEHVNEVANATLFPVANSWYLGANIPGKPRVFMPYIGFPSYVEKCHQVVANGYEGFSLS